MKQRMRVWVLLLTAVTLAAADTLIGTWKAADASATLKIVSKNRLVYNGVPYACRVDPQVIYLQDPEEGVVPYPYRVSGDRLIVAFPEGYTVQFRRVSASAKKKAVAPSPPSGSGENYLLRGKFCSYSGSSGGGTSYSSNPWAWFDGRGTFRYGTNSYYSGGGDLYANEGGGSGGTYEVHGDTIVLHFPDGSTSNAYVHYRIGGGRISEFKYGSALYAPQLCE